MRRVVLVFLLLSCVPDFVETDPPQLSRIVRTLTPVDVQEPVVYGLILDLDIPDAQVCTEAEAAIENGLAAQLLPPGRAGLKLSTLELAPGCVPPTDRRIDLSTWQDELTALQRQEPSAFLRPVFIYVNDTIAPIPPDLSNDLIGLRAWAPWYGQLWGLVAVRGMVTFDQQFTWTDATDPALMDQVAKAAAGRLPLMTRPATQLAPLLTDAERAGALAFKICGLHDATTNDFPSDGSAVTLDVDTPELTLQWQQQLAVPASSLPKASAKVDVELCHAKCERQAIEPGDGAYAPWSRTTGCFLAAGESAP